MDPERIAENLAAVAAHFHSEAEREAYRGLRDAFGDDWRRA